MCEDVFRLESIRITFRDRKTDEIPTVKMLAHEYQVTNFFTSVD